MKHPASENKNRTGTKDLKQQVKELLWKNMIEGESGSYTFHYTKPSPGTYPFQYFWDTCFHVFTLTALGEHDMVKKHLRSLFAMQDKSGFVGHIIYWKHTRPGRMFDLFQLAPKTWLKLFRPHMSALVQPPLAAQALQRIYQRTGDKKYLQEMLPKLKKYYHWLLKNRDFEGNNLISIITPYESGMDWKASYDPVLGFKGKGNLLLFWKVLKTDMFNFFKGYNLKAIYQAGKFVVKDAAFNTIFAQNLEALALLCAELDDPDAAFSGKEQRSVPPVF